MFGGDGFRVGLTVAPLEPGLPQGWPVPAGVSRRPARLSEVLPPAGRSRAGLAAELSRLQESKAQLAAYEAALVVALAGHDPDPDDPRQPGEFFVDELAAALGTSVTAAGATWALQATLHDRLPGTWTALADGELDWSRGRAIAAEVAAAGGPEPIVCMAVEAAVLPVAAELTVTRLRALVRRELVAHDAAYAERRRRAVERHADTRVRPDPAAPGRAVLEADLSTEEAHACWDLADSLARTAKAAGDARPIGVLRAEAIRDRILRPAVEDPPINAHVTVLAPLDALQRAAAKGRAAPGNPTRRRREPVGEVAGQPITAAHLRALLESVDALCPGGLQPPTGGRLRYALTDPDGALRAVLTDRELRRLARRGCPAHPTGDCGCPLVDRPPEVHRYRPSAAQQEFVRTRDRGCRMPGCTARAAWADLDHVIPHARGGTTSCTNLCCLCRRHHRLKTRARGWTTRLDPDGTYTVTSPSGTTRTTRPPGTLTTAVAARAPDPPPGPAPPPF